ncbi:MAG TPA: tRNA (adenosine(37)-N6)-threonylcarbamoyltransferase complex dimerization subunit type 1 TsaB [Oscillospiraceae bacterium]|nr:tRNA (adenosine(37)-N6)-threonylcarbamoyltransferase complex dimerization subunit type 1 TsaB [Oscillospiraceae bacterium]HNW05249.1 tRNA (adenosine(37)-N6)-threonylcarbamoyltransferase complex dimerization subunit type 1 TsaB [Oscillospiraceae bacterium]
MKILGFDTAAKTASVAAMDESGRLLALSYLDSGFTHSETVLPMAKNLLDALHMTPAEIDLYAVNCGPGSFTGLRIGIAAVKAMAFALDKPCAGASTLEALAWCAADWGMPVCAAMDARCGQVYYALFDCSAREPRRLCEDRTAPAGGLLSELAACAERYGKILLMGDGARLLGETYGDLCRPAPPNLVFGSAYGTCAAALCAYREGKTVSADALAPSYLKPAQAQREREAKLGGA